MKCDPQSETSNSQQLLGCQVTDRSEDGPRPLVFLCVCVCVCVCVCPSELLMSMVAHTGSRTRVYVFICLGVIFILFQYHAAFVFAYNL